MSDCGGEILVACIGNIFLGDDGFGAEVARALAAIELPAEAKLVDYGIRGFDLAYALLEPWRAMILVDAIARGSAAGSLYLLQAAAGPDSDQPCADDFNPHAMSPAQVLALARSLGVVRAPIYIVGCEPQDFGDDLEGRMELSAVVAAAVPEAAKMVLRLIEQLTHAGDVVCAS